jgi:hypothetical protein
MSRSTPGLIVRSMTRSMRICLAAIVAVAAMTMTAAPSPAAPKPARSGTITGWGVLWPATVVGSSTFSATALDCDGNPECAAWLESGCSPALAGRDPAVTASIVDITALADQARSRAFAWRAGDRADLPEAARAVRRLLWSDESHLLPHRGGVVVQLWDDDCQEIDRWYSLYGRDGATGRALHRMGTMLSIPSAAAWMTVTTNDTADLRWTLT